MKISESFGCFSSVPGISLEARAAEKLGILYNTGEGGLHEDFYRYGKNTIVQVPSGRFGVYKDYLEAGAAIVNDVSGFRDPAMVDVATACDAGLVVMHMKGEPKTMQDDPVYDDVVAEVRDYLQTRARELEEAGVARERICIDPGPGFAKTPSRE